MPDSTSATMPRKVLLAAAFCMALAPSAFADTAQGQFAIEGAGLAQCKAFTEAKTAKSDAFSRFVGWIEGYITASNRFTGDTFDLAPWQTPEIFGVILGDYCTKNPEERLFTVVQKLIVSLTETRLKTSSEQVVLTAKSKTAPNQRPLSLSIYTEVIRHAQQELKNQGLYQGNVTGVWSEDTQRAVSFYQVAVGLDDTGLPDPLTLWVLFSPQKAANTVASSSGTLVPANAAPASGPSAFKTTAPAPRPAPPANARPPAANARK